MPDFEHARRTMVDNQLRTSNVTDRRVLAAFGDVPRERFVPAERQALAYVDVEPPLGAGRELAAPAPFAKLLQLAGIEHTDRVLDVGAGTGYSTAVLARLAAEVVGLESDPALAAKARDNLVALGAGNAKIVEASVDGSGRYGAPFDVIVVEGAVETVPEGLFHQLKDGGRLVALLSSGVTAVANIFVKSGKDVASRAEFNASLPLLPVAAHGEEFVF